MPLKKCKKSYFILFSIIVSLLMLNSCATKKAYNAANKVTDTREVEFFLQSPTLTFVEALTMRGDIICKESKNVPVPKHLSNRFVPNTSVPLQTVYVKITYTAWTKTKERTAKVLNALALQNPTSIANSKVRINTIFDIPDEYCSDIEIIIPKGFDVEWFVKAADGKIKLPN